MEDTSQHKLCKLMADGFECKDMLHGFPGCFTGFEGFVDVAFNVLEGLALFMMKSTGGLRAWVQQLHGGLFRVGR